MAAAITMLLLVFIQVVSASALEPASNRGISVSQFHFTGCVSTNMETFHCRWTAGAFQRFAKPGDLRLFYINKKPPPIPQQEWTECPHYSTDNPNECFFNENHTSVWTFYRVQLRSRFQSFIYDEIHFHVQDIVQPDPPFALNWTLLNASLTGTHNDIMLSWKPPQSADVETGWMTLQYEVQYRGVSSDLWEVVDLVKSTHRSLYGLQTDVNHEVRVRCKMFGGKEFGEFSDSVFVHIKSKVSRIPVVALLIFGALCLLAILMIVIICQQGKLMVILLPLVPGPKIRGIEPELLKKGKLRELTSILGTPPALRPELYNNNPWVEFIDVVIEEQSDKLTDLDTDCLMEHSHPSICTPLFISFRDDDSGRASCCDPDIPSDPEASSFHNPILNKTLNNETTCPTACEPISLVQSPTSGEPPLVAPSREAPYTQVTEVRSSGKVLLSPEEQTEVEISKDAKKERRKGVQLLVVNPDRGGYTSEVSAGKRSLRLSTEDMSEKCQTGGDLGSSLLPHQESDTPISSPHPAPYPPPVYTVVEGVDRQNSLLLTQNSKPVPQLIIQKNIPTPGDYLTPDLLGSITP